MAEHGRRWLLGVAALSSASSLAACRRDGRWLWESERLASNPKGIVYDAGAAATIGPPAPDASDEPEATAEEPDARPVIRPHANPKGVVYDSGMIGRGRDGGPGGPPGGSRE